MEPRTEAAGGFTLAECSAPGSRLVAPPPGIRCNAVFSADRRFRYALWRTWDIARPAVMFVGLNPSQANEVNDDPTLRRCVGFAKAWGYGGVALTNLFGFVATDPAHMLATPDPIGEDNDWWLAGLSAALPLTVAAWGNAGTHRARAAQARPLLQSLHVLRLNRSGQPAHPLYLPASLTPRPWDH